MKLLKAVVKALPWLLIFTSIAIYAHQPTPPVTVSVKVIESGADELLAEVTVTPNVNLDNARFVVKNQKGLEAEPKSQRLQYEAGRSEVVKVRLKSDSEEPLRVDFTVTADAKNYERAGGTSRRYVVKNQQGALTLVTGAQLRDKSRKQAWEQIEKSQREDPKKGESIYDIISGPLKEVDKRQINPKLVEPQLLAPPAGGIERLEHDVIVDSTKDNIREVDPITVTGAFFYVDRNGVTRPLVNATVDIRDDDTFGDEQLTSVVTGWDGSYSAVVNADDGWLQNGRDIYARVRTTNARFRVQDCGLFDSTFSWTTDVREDLSDGAVVNFGNLQPGSDMDAAVMFQDMNKAWNHMTTTGSQDPGFVNLCWPEGATNYDFSNVNITDGDEVAEDVVLHEYGHAIMHNAYDNNYWPANAVGPHTFCDPTPQNRNLAFTEGWATFVALSVNPDGVYDSASWSWNLENNSCNNTNGKRDETMVAAGLIDMRDTASDGNCSSGNCDPSGSNNVSMVDLWRDTVFAQNIDDMDEYWDVLCPELSEAQHDDAITSLDFNNIDVPACQCTAELTFQQSGVSKAESAGMLKSLREFRDVGLLKTTTGKRMVEYYYKHNREASEVILSDPRMASRAYTVFSSVARNMKAYALGKGKDGPLLDEKAAAAAQELAKQLGEKASPEFRAAIFEAQGLIDTASSVPMSRMEHILNRPSPK